MLSNNQKKIIVVRGAGEMASGVIHCLFKYGYSVIALEQENPVCVRRLVCFANAYYESKVDVEGVRSVLVHDIDEALKTINNNIVPLLVDEDGTCVKNISPIAVIDGRMLKKNVDNKMTSSQIFIGLGPGFEAGRNCHAVIETNRGENLGNVILDGKAEEYTGVPAKVHNYSHERVLRSPADGKFNSHFCIGDLVKANDTIAIVNNVEVKTQIDGVVRGLIHNNVIAYKGQKIGDIDPRGDNEKCNKISDKAQAIGAGVLDALQQLIKT